jgi:hypothetical protein
MAEKKITKREVINTMLADENVKGNEMYVAYLQNELALLDKKAQRKVTKENDENVTYMGAIMEVLASGRMTISEMQKNSDVLGTLSNQKVSALARKLVEQGSVEKVTEKGKSYFALA